MDWEDIFHLAIGDFGDGGNKVNIDNDRLVVSGFAKLENGDEVGIIKIYSYSNGNIEQNVIVSSQNAYSVDNSFTISNRLYYIGIGYQGQSPINNILAVTGCFLMPKISSSADESRYPSRIIAFPNPTADMIFISEIDLNVFEDISLCDMNGRIVIQKRIEAEQEKILLSEFPPGIYTVCVHGKNMKVMKKIVKI